MSLAPYKEQAMTWELTVLDPEKPKAEQLVELVEDSEVEFRAVQLAGVYHLPVSGYQVDGVDDLFARPDGYLAHPCTLPGDGEYVGPQ